MGFKGITFFLLFVCVCAWNEDLHILSLSPVLSPYNATALGFKPTKLRVDFTGTIDDLDGEKPLVS